MTRVDFLLGPRNLGDDFGDFLTVVWTNRVPGTYTCFAKATDRTGTAALSAPVNLVVAPPRNHQE